LSKANPAANSRNNQSKATSLKNEIRGQREMTATTIDREASAIITTANLIETAKICQGMKKNNINLIRIQTSDNFTSTTPSSTKL
jgi:hypothetical protein